MIVAIMLALFFTTRTPAAPRAMSVCEVARIGGKLDGKAVRIMGVWRSRSGVGLFDELVDNTCPGIEIHVVFTPVSLPHPPPPTGYKLDVRSAGKARRLTEKALADGREVSATIAGLLYVEKKEDYVPARSSENGVIAPPLHKWYPLVLLLEAVPEIRER